MCRCYIKKCRYQENAETKIDYQKRRYQVNPEIHKKYTKRYQEKKKRCD